MTKEEFAQKTEQLTSEKLSEGSTKKNDLMTEISDLISMLKEVDESKQKIEKKLSDLTQQMAEVCGDVRKFRWPETTGPWFQIKKSKLGKWFMIPFEDKEPGSWIKKDKK